MKTLYRQLEKLWGEYLLGPEWSPFVVLSDWLKSPCAYCHFWRGVMLGGGVVAFFDGHILLGILLVLLPFFLAAAEERYGDDQ